MNQLENLQPSILTNLPKDYRVTYRLPNGQWSSSGKKFDLWQVWYIVHFCFRFGRTVRVLEISSGKILSEYSSLLNLFSYRLSGRKAQSPINVEL